jgi:hypothetical protein
MKRGERVTAGDKTNESREIRSDSTTRARSADSARTWRFPTLWRNLLVRVAVVTSAIAGALLSCGVEKSPSESVGVARQALITVKSFQQLSLPTGTYAGASDATLRESNPTLHDSDDITCDVDGDNGGGVDKSCVIRWDVGEIPPGSTVTDASITLHLVDDGTQPYGIYELLRTWSGTEVSWNVARTGQNWATPGANGATDRGVLLGNVSGGAGTMQTVQLNGAGRARVQAWINDPSSNAGVIIANTTNVEGIDFASSENATESFRPKLTVTYDTGGGTGGTGGTGGSGGTAGHPDLIVAFIGDQDNNFTDPANAPAKKVLDLIVSEGAQAVVHNGDFDYENDPSGWVGMINTALGSNFPYYAVVGNHEAAASAAYLQAIQARANDIPQMRDYCTGTHGLATSCDFKGIRLVQSCVGLDEINAALCDEDLPGPSEYIRQSLDDGNSIWRVCNWHKVQAQMSVSDNVDEVGWQPYNECMDAGAIIITAHSHTYARTFTLTDIDNPTNKGQGVFGTASEMQVGAGKTFVLVAGIGGRGLYNVKTNPVPEAWWASYFTNNARLQSGSTQQVPHTGRQGALFIKFNVGGDPRRAEGWVKDTSLQTLDSFTIQAL